MLPIVPHAMRIRAATLATVVAALCAACGWTTAGSAGLIAPVSVDCGLQAPGPSGVGGVFNEIPGFTVTQICPADIDPDFPSQEFQALAAGVVSQNGTPIMRVLAGQLNSSAEEFVGNYLGTLSAQTPAGVGVPSEPEQLGGHAVTHFNIPLVTDGYAYAAGSTVVIAYVASGSPPATVEDGLIKVLDNASR
jgi:hypothetical protein